MGTRHGRQSCEYIVKPTELLHRRDIPRDSPVWWRYDILLEHAWIETGSEYAYVTVSNTELAKMWETDVETARKGLAKMISLHLVETERWGSTGRIIRLLVAWRRQGRGQPAGINAPDQQAARLEAQVPATGVLLQQDDDPAALIGVGGKQTTTQSDLSNAAAVFNSSSLGDQQQQINPDARGMSGKQMTTQEAGVGGKQTTTQEDEERRHIKKILQGAGFRPPAPTRLSERVGFLTALEWSYWVQSQPQQFDNPAGYAVSVLAEDPFASPPDMPAVFDQARRNPDLFRCQGTCKFCREGGPFDTEFDALLSLDDIPSRPDEILPVEMQATASEDDAESPNDADDSCAPSQYSLTLEGVSLSSANDVWYATLGELQLQMTRATFDFWVRPTRVLGWENGHDGSAPTLVVRAHSPYAKEWLEARLNASVQRVATGIVGRAVEIRYVAPEEVRA